MKKETSMSNCTVIAVVNQKGGVGKTTSTYNLGWELGKLGKKVLLVDLDSQANLTMQAGVPTPDKLSFTLATLLTKCIYDDEFTYDNEDILIHKEMIDLLPSNIELSNVEIQIVNVMSRESVLDRILEKFKKDYDYIIIDCMPSLGMMPINALVAANKVIIPVVPEFWAVKGIEALLKTIKNVKKKMNSGLEIEGILLTKYTPNLRITKEMEQIITDVFGERINVFDSKIPAVTKMGDTAINSLSAREMYECLKIKKHKDAIEKVMSAYQNLSLEIVNKEVK